MREFETLRDFFASATLTAVVDVPFILLTLAVIALIGGKVVLVPLLMVPLVMLVGWLTQPAMDRLSARSMNEGFLKQSVLVETIGGARDGQGLGRRAAARRGAGSQAIEQHSRQLAAAAAGRRHRHQHRRRPRARSPMPAWSSSARA